MLPIISVPQTIASRMQKYRNIFCREEGFEHVCRYITGLVISPNKTLDGIYDVQVWDGEKPSRRAMHETVFEAGWDSDEFMGQHRAEAAVDHRGQGKEVIDLDWTFSHHDRGPQIYGVRTIFDSFTCLIDKLLASFIDDHLYEVSNCKNCSVRYRSW